MNYNQAKAYLVVVIFVLLGLSSAVTAQDSYQVYKHVNAVSVGDKIQIEHPLPEANSVYEVNVELLYTKNRHTDVAGLTFTSEFDYNLASVDQTETVISGESLNIHYTSGDRSLERSKKKYSATSNEIELEIVALNNSGNVPEDVEIRLSITKVNGPNYTFPVGILHELQLYPTQR